MHDAWEPEWFPRALSRFLTHNDASRLAVAALYDMRVAIARVLVGLHGPLAPISPRNLLVCAAIHGDWDAVVVLQQRLKPTSQRHREPQQHRHVQDLLDEILAATGKACPTSLQRAIELHRRHPVQFPSRVIYEAARLGRLSELVWLHSMDKYNALQAIEAAARGGHARAVQWLLDHASETVEADAAQESPVAVQCTVRLDDSELADFGIIAWRVEPANVAYCCVAEVGFLPPHREFRSAKGYPMMDWAASKGKLDLLVRLSAHPAANSSLSRNALSLAAAQGHLHVVQWLVDTQRELVEMNFPWAMAEAARRGDLVMVRWLRRVIDSSHSLTIVLDAACESGRLDVLRWVFRNFLDERIRPRFLLLTAATHGSLEIVRFLHEEQGYSLSASALEHAVARGHLEVAQWMYSRLPSIEDSQKSMLISHAAKAGHLAIIKWLIGDLGLWSEQAVANAPWALGDTGIQILDYLYTRDLETTVETLSKLSIVQLIIHHGNSRVAEWILEKTSEPSSARIPVADLEWFTAFRRDYFHRDRFAAGQDDRPRRGPRNGSANQPQYYQRHALDSLILEKRPRFCRQVASFPVWAALSGDLDWLEQLLAIDHPHLFTSKVFNAILRDSRNPAVMAWILKRRSFSKKETVKIVRWAAQWGAISVLQLVVRPGVLADVDMFKLLRVCAWSAARYGHVEVLQFVADCVARAPCTSDAMKRKIWSNIAFPCATHGHSTG